MAKIIFKFEDKSIPQQEFDIQGKDKSVLEITEELWWGMRLFHMSHLCKFRGPFSGRYFR